MIATQPFCLRVAVSAEDYQRGDPHSYGFCPLALAISRALSATNEGPAGWRVAVHSEAVCLYRQTERAGTVQRWAALAEAPREFARALRQGFPSNATERADLPEPFTLEFVPRKGGQPNAD